MHKVVNDFDRELGNVVISDLRGTIDGSALSGTSFGQAEVLFWCFLCLGDFFHYGLRDCT